MITVRKCHTDNEILFPLVAQLVNLHSHTKIGNLIVLYADKNGKQIVKNVFVAFLLELNCSIKNGI